MASCLSTRQYRINLFCAFLYEVIHISTLSIPHCSLYGTLKTKEQTPKQKARTAKAPSYRATLFAKQTKKHTQKASPTAAPTPYFTNKQPLTIV